MESELKKLAAAMRDMSGMVGDHHWQAAKAIEELGVLKSNNAEPDQQLDVARGASTANAIEIVRGLDDLPPMYFRMVTDALQQYAEPGEKLGADGLEVVAWAVERDGDASFPWLCKTQLGAEDNAKLVTLRPAARVTSLCRLTDAQRLLSQLREELAQRNAEVERLWADRKTDAALIHELRTKLHALESQQAASVGGERECTCPKINSAGKPGLCPIHDARYIEQQKARAALSPAGGGVVQVCKLGAYGIAYDMPDTYRAFTYAEQPNNPIAWKLGRALSDAHKAGGGDWIDYGLGLLKTLQAEGFGVFQIAKPLCATCDDNGRIGGPSFYAPDEGGDPCPDCAKPQANSQEGQP